MDVMIVTDSIKVSFFIVVIALFFILKWPLFSVLVFDKLLNVLGNIDIIQVILKF